MLAGGPALADPAAIVAKLKSTPASLFDLSLARLEAEVNGDGSGNGFDAYVNFQDNEVVIYASSSHAPVTEKACRGIIDTIKLLGDDNPKSLLCEIHAGYGQILDALHGRRAMSVLVSGGAACGARHADGREPGRHGSSIQAVPAADVGGDHPRAGQNCRGDL